MQYNTATNGALVSSLEVGTSSISLKVIEDYSFRGRTGIVSFVMIEMKGRSSGPDVTMVSREKDVVTSVFVSVCCEPGISRWWRVLQTGGERLKRV